MRIALIKPKIGHRQKGSYIDEGRMEPLMLGVLAGLTPAEHQLKLWDDRFEEIDFDDRCDLAAITVETFTARRAYEISAEYRKRNIPVVMGGMHATLLPQEVQTHCDALATGDAEGCWEEILSDAQSGCLQNFYHGCTDQVQNNKPARRDLYAGKGYLKVSLIQASRGCPNECTYCATSAYFGHKHYSRETEDVIHEIGDKKVLFFVDDNFTADKLRVKELLKKMIPLKIFWVGQLSLEAAMDEELLLLMEKSGCLGFVVGFESITSENVSWMKKNNVNDGVAQAYAFQIARLKDHGFQIWAAFTIGHDFDTVSSIEDTVDFALKNKFTFAAFNTLLPYPSTPLYQKLNEENRLLFGGKWWLHPDYRFNHAAFIPANMTADQLTVAGMAARKKFNSIPSLLMRTFDLKTNLRSIPRFLYFAKYSLLFKREVKKKEGMVFGSEGSFI